MKNQNSKTKLSLTFTKSQRVFNTQVSQKQYSLTQPKQKSQSRIEILKRISSPISSYSSISRRISQNRSQRGLLLTKGLNNCKEQGKLIKTSQLNLQDHLRYKIMSAYKSIIQTKRTFTQSIETNNQTQQKQQHISCFQTPINQLLFLDQKPKKSKIKLAKFLNNQLFKRNKFILS